MSASTFGFEEVEIGQLLPRIGLAFLGANVSLSTLREKPGLQPGSESCLYLRGMMA